MAWRQKSSRLLVPLWWPDQAQNQFQAPFGGASWCWRWCDCHKAPYTYMMCQLFEFNSQRVRWRGCTAPPYFEINCNTTPNLEDYTMYPKWQIGVQNWKSIKAKYPCLQIPNAPSVTDIIFIFSLKIGFQSFLFLNYVFTLKLSLLISWKCVLIQHNFCLYTIALFPD